MFKSSKVYVLYHKNCPDGFGSAFCAWLHFGDSAEYVPVAYGEPMPTLEDGSLVYILDFSFKRDVMEELAKRVTLCVLDHHASAEKDLDGLPYCHFDMTKSGALLSWEHFSKLSNRLDDYWLFIRYISDRDLATNKLSETFEFSSVLSSYEKDFHTWKEIGKIPQKLMEEGKSILRHINTTVDMICNQATRTKKFDGIVCNGVELKDVPIVNTTAYWFEVGLEMMKRFPNDPVLSFYTNRADVRQWSLRSHKPEFDVSELAKFFGGGGHKQASGFTESLDINPLHCHLKMLSKKYK